jgi:hydrogenase/urease accessory protein HupE
MISSTAFVARLACAAAVALLCSPTLRAHEIGTTRVAVLFDDDRNYDVEVVTDATALVEKLEAVVPGNADPAHLQSLLARSDEAFRERVKIGFDASEVRPAIQYTVAPGPDTASPPVATIRFTGQIPPGARHFTWTYAWTFASYAITIRRSASENAATAWLEGGESSEPFALRPAHRPADRFEVARRYLTLGFTHIVPHGVDHMLFVLGICLLSGRARPVLWQVSAFTAAHSITLALSVCGVVTVSPGIVEPLIAISIAYVAIENIFLSELKYWRLALVFAFGLLHGLGFAGALGTLGLPGAEFATALLMFNIGVEAGQLAVIGAAFMLVGWHCAHRDWYRSRIVVPASMMIATTAIYWTIERLSP